MAGFQDLVETLTVIFSDRLQNKIEYTHGLLGDGNGRVRVSTIPGSPDVDYVYARPDRASQRVYKVFNKRVQGQDGDPIIIGTLPWEPELIQIVDLDWDAYKTVGWGDDVTTTSRHGSSHQWRDGAPGIDAFDVYRRQLGDLKTYSIASGTMDVGVSPYSLNINQIQYQWAGTHGLSLTGAVPAGTGTALMALVYWSPVSGTTAGYLGVATGTAGSSAGAAFLNRPVTPKGAIPSAFVKLRGGQTSINEFDIWDAREPFKLGDFYGPGSYLWEGGVTITSDLLVKADDIGRHNNFVVSMSSDTAGRGSLVSFLRSGAGDTAVSDGKLIGQVSFSGHDGTNYVTSAGISAFVDGTVATGAVPMYMDFAVSGSSWQNRETRLKLATGTVSIGDVDGTFVVDVNFNNGQMVLQGSDSLLTLEGKLSLPDDIVHTGDPDTKIGFTTDDIEFTVGGLSMLKLTEAAQDLITLGPGSGDVDIDFNGDMFLQGSTGWLAVGLPSSPAGNVHIASDTGTELYIQTSNNSPSQNAAVIMRRSRGTIASPTAIQSGDFIFQLALDAHNGTAYEGARRIIESTATENWTVSNGGFEAAIYTRLNGTVGAPTKRVTIDNKGFTGLNGVTAPSTALDLGAGAIEGDEMSAPGAGAANTWRLYAVDNGGKTEVYIIFNTGAAQLIAAQP